MIATRNMKASDRDAIISIHKQSIYGLCKGHYTEREMNAWIARLTPELFEEGIKDENNIGIVAEEGNTVIGYGFFNARDRELRALYVLPRYGGRGAGRRIMARLEEIAREKSIKTLTLQSTMNAVGFYRLLGYREIGSEMHPIDDEISITCVRMEKDLRQ